MKEIEISIERGYLVAKVKNGWVLECSHSSFVCDTLSEALDQLNAEEEKFPVEGA